MNQTITKQDILPLDAYLKIRPQKQKEIMEVKKLRRVPIGPDMTFYFESYDTIWWQIHEMLRIEKGGDDQIQDELQAYATLIPKRHPDQSQELVATMMIEIDDMIRRRETLAQLGGIEETIFLSFQNTEIKGVPETDLDRTDETGKTSSVHFIHFLLGKADIESFIQPGQDVILEVRHPLYSHKTLLSDSTRQTLSKDLLFYR